MKIYGLTGGIASGKSTASEMLRDEGLVVIDADQLAREVVGRGSFGLNALVQVFGPEILQGDELNRAALRDKIFSDPSSRLVVERITHPLIQWRAKQEFKALEREGQKTVIYDAALIYEKDLAKQFSKIIVVHVPFDIQVQRFTARDKISRDVAEQRLKSQWPLDKKKEQAHLVIDNSGSREQTKKQVRDLAARLRG